MHHHPLDDVGVPSLVAINQKEGCCKAFSPDSVLTMTKQAIHSTVVKTVN